MNILFHTYGKVYSLSGGTERTTITVAQGLKLFYNCDCFSLYEKTACSPAEKCFVDEFNWKVSKNWDANIAWLHAILQEHNIDIIVVQGSFIRVKCFREAVKGLNCKIVLAHHFEPGAEQLFYSLKHQLSSYSSSSSFSEKLRWLKYTLLFPFVRAKQLNSLRNEYREAYEYADKVVLLSSKFIKPYQDFGKFEDAGKFSIIPNGLSFDEFYPEDELAQKKSVVLIVSRLDEIHKRLSLAFKIWGMIQKSGMAKNWKLNVVGDGPDLNAYQRLIRIEHIDQVCFLGRQDPIPYYKEASIFMLTSQSESWGLTLTEAQQFGVVPVAFNSYASLSDIITHGEDGMIVPEGDMKGYMECMIQLMFDVGLREKMARQGICNSKRFAQKKITENWYSLFKQLTEKK